MKHDMFWLLLLSLGGLYIFPNVILFRMFSSAMSINIPSQIVESLYRSLRSVWVYRLLLTGYTVRRCEQLDTFPETIEQELRPAVCER